MKIFEEMLIDKMNLFLDYTVRRQEVISSNLANVDTPGYKTKDLEFKDVFGAELEQASSVRITEPGHISSRNVAEREAVVKRVETGALGNDLNNVDLDREMTNLAVNVLKFSTVTQMVRSKFQLLGLSIRGG